MGTLHDREIGTGGIGTYYQLFLVDATVDVLQVVQGAEVRYVHCSGVVVDMTADGRQLTIDDGTATACVTLPEEMEADATIEAGCFVDVLGQIPSTPCLSHEERRIAAHSVQASEGWNVEVLRWVQRVHQYKTDYFSTWYKEDAEQLSVAPNSFDQQASQHSSLQSLSQGEPVPKGDFTENQVRDVEAIIAGSQEKGVSVQDLAASSLPSVSLSVLQSILDHVRMRICSCMGRRRSRSTLWCA
eukprot:m.164226 g.164226  ORF g.164226 m.164226 type:complete len:243 (+) comp14398_c0_seq8:2273-3001(+)